MKKFMNISTGVIAASFIIGLLIGIGGTILYKQGASNTPTSSQEVSSSNDENINSTMASSKYVEAGSFAGNGPAIRVSDQNPGKSVVIEQVALTAPGWVTIRDNDNGKPGKILGARLFDKGRNSGIVELLRATEAGKTYFAMLHSDDGNYKSFDSKKDLPLKDDSGKEVMAVFAVTVATD